MVDEKNTPNIDPQTVEEKVLFKQIGKVAYITLNNPKKMNAIEKPMVDRILKLLKEVDQNEKVNCVVINSTGDRVFCSGWDLNIFKEVSQENIDFLLNIGATISRTIFFLKKPVIVAIQGPAVGMGTIISLAADFRIVAKKDNIFFQLPELEVGPGIPPATGPTFGSVVTLGLARAKDMLLTARKVSLTEFDKWGLITEIVDPPEELARVVKKFARNLAKKSGKLLSLTKHCSNIIAAEMAKEAWELENEMAYYYFNLIMKNYKQSEQSLDEFLRHLWEKYGKGMP
ncbi:MAG: enoyl-CoA hydratase/isomerase family protein [Promethearchaeota archaeon]